jgi:hypothetical protein
MSLLSNSIHLINHTSDVALSSLVIGIYDWWDHLLSSQVDITTTITVVNPLPATIGGTASERITLTGNSHREWSTHIDMSSQFSLFTGRRYPDS